MGKSMKRKVEPKTSSVLQPLYNNRVLRVEVDEALDNEVPYDKIIGLCAQYGVSISKSSLTRYKAKREEAKEKGQDLGEIVDKRTKDEFQDIEDKQDGDIGEVQPVVNDLQVLDAIVQKMGEGIALSKGYPSIRDGIKAMEVKAKLTNNAYHGMTMAGFRELKIRQEARTQAITQAMMKYVPEDKQEAAIAEMDSAEKDFYKSLNLSDSEKKLEDILRKSGIDM